MGWSNPGKTDKEVPEVLTPLTYVRSTPTHAPQACAQAAQARHHRHHRSRPHPGRVAGNSHRVPRVSRYREIWHRLRIPYPTAGGKAGAVSRIQGGAVFWRHAV